MPRRSAEPRSVTIAPPSASRPGTTGSRARRRTRANEPVPYDFRRPIQLSREHQRILMLGFDGFARQATTVFTSSLRTVCQLTLQTIEQQTYNEYVESLGAQTYMMLFAADPMTGLGVLEMPVPAVMSCVDHMLGGPGSDDQPDRPLTEIESGVIKGFMDRLLNEMRYSLAAVLPLEPSAAAVEYAPQFAQAASPADVMVVVEFELRINERAHRATICLPFSGLHPYLTNSSNPGPVSDREKAARLHAADMLRQQMDHVPVTVAVRFHPTQLGPVDLSQVQVGDVLRLSHPSTAPLDVTLDGATFARATPGAHGQRLAALIVNTPKENS